MQQGYAHPPQSYGYPPQQMMAPQPMVVVQQSHTMVTQKAPFNHGAHLLITVLTCGAWLPIWIVLALIH